MPMMTRRELLIASGGAIAAAGFLGCATHRHERSPSTFTSVHDSMAAQVERNLFPGAVWLVARGGDVFVDAVGVTAIGGATPMCRDTIFRIASMTKAVTATAVMMLIEDGKLALEAPAQRWLPEIADRRVLRLIDGPLDDTVPARRAITVRDLLAFTLGFGVLFEGGPPIQRAIDELELVNG